MVKAETGGAGADVVFDPVGGTAFEQSTKCIAFEGRIVVVGFAGGTIQAVNAGHALVKNYGVLGLHWALYAQRRPELVDAAHVELTRLIDAGQVRPVVGEVVAVRGRSDRGAAARRRRHHGPPGGAGRMSDTRLDGRVALVSGAARGLGEAFARALHAAGASVVIADLLDDDAGRLAADLGDRALGHAPGRHVAGELGGHGRGHPRGVRHGRRAGQQRGHRERRADRPLPPGEVGRGHRGQPHRRVPRACRRWSRR